MKLFKKLNKGFTLVELVVVIAVIAILSAVSVVAYTGITKNARKNAAMQEARSAFNLYYSAEVVKSDFVVADCDLEIYHEGYKFVVTDGQFNPEGTESAVPTTGQYYTVGDNGLVEHPAA